MSVIETDQWLLNYISSKKSTFQDNFMVQRDLLCAPLTHYFSDANSETIQLHLIQHGLFHPDPHDQYVIRGMISNDYWKITTVQLATLQKKWEGPDISTFLFPSDFKNEQLRTELNGISGLSYPDKLFLFITEQTTSNQLKALIVHEYSHVIRFHYVHHQNSILTLRDALVLEGIAEVAVKQIVGENALSKATKIYDQSTAKKHWQNWIKANQNLTKTNPKHDLLMYGGDNVPKWAGYNVGYHLVNTYVEKVNPTLQELLRTPTNKIMEHSISKNVL
ncbi:hypothetical protein GCM10011351_30060 [Paraliobacillus quinghaiensis]|uniref:DUF2268 domain-containing protein n=1 Tax=Paraliobacillus quinghaiensis TaxID=470815 RepID=A0A917TWX4_9BACI|nr:DUF2268 domain-containing putative Zn-dependent protease [Paraliobacillus quinghaiensis]GGM41968.1 hypothetical protein GCM10011351_30060 [Paraliobacillus quinghaiensis]